MKFEESKNSDLLSYSLLPALKKKTLVSHVVKEADDKCEVIYRQSKYCTERVPAFVATKHDKILVLNKHMQTIHEYPFHEKLNISIVLSYDVVILNSKTTRESETYYYLFRISWQEIQELPTFGRKLFKQIVRMSEHVVLTQLDNQIGVWCLEEDCKLLYHTVISHSCSHAVKIDDNCFAVFDQGNGCLHIHNVALKQSSSLDVSITYKAKVQIKHVWDSIVLMQMTESTYWHPIEETVLVDYITGEKVSLGNVRWSTLHQNKLIALVLKNNRILMEEYELQSFKKKSIANLDYGSGLYYGGVLSNVIFEVINEGLRARVNMISYSGKKREVLRLKEAKVNQVLKCGEGSVYLQIDYELHLKYFYAKIASSAIIYHRSANMVEEAPVFSSLHSLMMFAPLRVTFTQERLFINRGFLDVRLTFS
jgi:hypothetical protein